MYFCNIHSHTKNFMADKIFIIGYPSKYSNELAEFESIPAAQRVTDEYFAVNANSLKEAKEIYENSWAGPRIIRLPEGKKFLVVYVQKAESMAEYENFHTETSELNLANAKKRYEELQADPKIYTVSICEIIKNHTGTL